LAKATKDFLRTLLDLVVYDSHWNLIPYFFKDVMEYYWTTELMLKYIKELSGVLV
jgi:hypothetical protein